MSRLLALLLLASLLAGSPARAAKVLFDAAHAEDAGNADWVIDDNFPLPLPAQSGIGPGTAGTFWTGAISSFGVSLVKRGYVAHSNVAALTYGNAGNTYDLANYDLLVLPEPNSPFSAAESTAIFDFVRDGGGLIVVLDHGGSDRNSDGWDAAEIWNALDAGRLMGVRCAISGEGNSNIVQTSNNVNPAASDSITHGPVGTVTALAFHNGTTMTLYPAVNPTVRGEVWMIGVLQTSPFYVMAASARYGSGRVCFVGDSSPVDDGTARPGNDSIFDGWGEAGASDSTLFLNAALWATRTGASQSDLIPPSVTLTSPVGGETWKAGSTHAITWTATDNVAVTGVDLAYSIDGGLTYPYTIANGLPNTGSYDWLVPNVPGTQNRVRIIAYDATPNTGVDMSPANFTIDRWLIVSSAGSGGGIVPSGNVYVADGQNRTFTITPSSGYHVADVLVDGASAGAVPSYTFTAVHANHTIAASFAPDGYVLSVSVVGDGSVTRDPDLAAYPPGTLVSLDAVPGAGWAFAGWSGDTVAAADPLTLVMNGPRSLTATFADVTPPQVTLLSPNGGEAWPFGSTHAITWSASDNATVSGVALEYSTAGGAGPWTPIAAGLANSGSFDWVVPASATTQASVRVLASDAATNAASDTSDAAFTLFEPGLGVEGGPVAFGLARPAPNPWSKLVQLGFGLPSPAHVRLDVIDASGRRVAGTSGEYGAGSHAWRWDGRLADGSRARAGVYFARLVTPFGTERVRLVRLD